MEPEIIQFLGNYGVLGFLVYVVIKDVSSYFKEKRIADTLKEANADRKTDTDEVARELNNKQENCLTELRTKVDFIALQVSNHLPTVIKEIADKLDKHIDEQSKFEKEILIRIMEKK